MNIAQVCRLALLNADAVQISGTTNRMYTLPELLAWANQGKEQIETVLRQARADYQALLLRSDDTDFRFNGWAYDVSTLELSGTTSFYHDLPPDFIAMKSIREITNSPPQVFFRWCDMNDPEFIELRGSSNPQRVELLWDIVGERTLFVANPPSSTVGIEIIYLAKSPRLRTYNTGTVTITQDTATVTGASTLWLDDEVSPTMQNSEIIVSTNTTPPAVVSQTTGLTYVDPNAIYQQISGITSDTAATLQGNWLTATVTSVGYILASRVEFPEEHIHALADYVSHRCMVKAKNWVAADKFESYWERHLAKFKADVEQRQLVALEFAEDFDIPDESY